MASNASDHASRIVKLDELRRCVLIVDDHALLAESLAQILREHGVSAEVSRSETPQGLLDEVSEIDDCLVLLDLSLSTGLGDGVDLIGPLIDAEAAVVVLTGTTDRVRLGECFEAGALGVIEKALPVEQVVERIRRMLGGGGVDLDRRHQLLGEMRLARERRSVEQAPFRTLTERECAVLEHLSDGLSAGEISSAMFISVATVRTHIRSILVKLGVHSQLAAVALAHERHWLH